MSATAGTGSAVTRPPIRVRSRSSASGAGSRGRSIRRAPCRATSPARLSRLVTRVRQDGEPGSSGRTASADRALSSSTRICRSASRLRYRALRSARSYGTSAGLTPSARRKPASTSPGSVGCSGPYPRRSTYNWPSGKCSAIRCAQCTASAVLPTPAVPDRATITLPVRPTPPASRFSSAISVFRPANPYTSGGSSRGTAVPGRRARPPVPVGGRRGGVPSTASLASSSCQRCVHSSVEPPHAPTYASVTDSDGRVTPPAAADSAAAEYPARRANAR